VKIFETAVVALAHALRTSGRKLATAESCTGGLIAGACTTIAGSSVWFERGFVTYSNEAKIEMLGIDSGLIATHGAVSREVAQAMAEGALTHSRADLSVAVTGIAGPDGGSPSKPVGTVWLAIAQRACATQVELLMLTGDRAAIREKTVHHALRSLIARVGPAH
jgi:nicotinamide-nucleotide amidase